MGLNNQVLNMRHIHAILLTSLVAIGGCATTNGDPRDPLEPMNRAIYSFNDKVDRAVTKPVAKAYKAVTPRFVATGVHNFFANLGDVTVLTNDLLQFKIRNASSDFLRLSFNSTFGLFGFFDVASEMRLVKNDEDFGQTLGYWGIHTGPYLVLPFFGPSDFRDTVGFFVDNNYTDPVRHIERVGVRNRTALVRVISRRADLLEAERVVEAAALDPYEFTRDFYLQQRRSLVYDGKPPREDE
jgi:phospholipid-binding lipoprotein MlaA